MRVSIGSDLKFSKSKRTRVSQSVSWKHDVRSHPFAYHVWGHRVQNTRIQRGSCTHIQICCTPFSKLTSDGIGTAFLRIGQQRLWNLRFSLIAFICFHFVMRKGGRCLWLGTEMSGGRDFRRIAKPRRSNLPSESGRSSS